MIEYSVHWCAGVVHWMLRTVNVVWYFFVRRLQITLVPPRRAKECRKNFTSGLSHKRNNVPYISAFKVPPIFLVKGI